MSFDRGKIIYIAGYGRSGTTLIDVILGNSKNCIGLGEISNFYIDLINNETEKNIFGEKRQEFWLNIEKVIKKRLKNSIEIKNAKMAQIQMESLLGIISGSRTSLLKKRYFETQGLLFDTIKYFSNCDVVIDSSKTSRLTTWRPVALAKLDGYELKMVHIVRDGRSVLSSQLRGDNRKIFAKEENQKLSWPFLRTVLGWSIANINAIFYKIIFREKFHIIFYEDLILNTNNELNKLQNFTNLDLSDTIKKLNKKQPIFGKYQFRGNRLLKKPICGINNNFKKDISLFYEICYWLICGILHLILYKIIRRNNN